MFTILNNTKDTNRKAEISPGIFIYIPMPQLQWRDTFHSKYAFKYILCENLQL